MLPLAAAALAACGPSEEPILDEPIVSMASAMPNVPLPPDGIPISSEGTGDALQLLVSTPVEADLVVAFYRETLSRAPYTLINDNVDGGVTTFYVEQAGEGQDGPALWVTVESLEAGGTLVRLAGAAVRQAAPAGSPDVSTADGS